LTTIVASFFLLEVVIGLLAWIIYRDRFSHEPRGFFSDTALQRERLEIRYGVPTDFSETEAIYHEWFRPSLSISDEEYIKILNRGPFMRVLEATIGIGGNRRKEILGFYDVWPLADDIFEALARGSLKERQLNAAHVLDFDDPQVTTLYVPEICVSRRFNDGSMLVRDMMRYVAHIIDRHPNIQRVAAWPYTTAGRELVKRFGMQRRRWRPFVPPIHEISSIRVKALPRPKGAFKDRRASEQ
jgi:hypothetical protein